MSARQGTGKVLQWDGKVITKPGIYKGVPLDLYHSSELFDGKPAVSSSGLRTIVRGSPAHYWATSPYNPARKENSDEEKKHFVIGRALHHLVGGEKRFAALFAVRPEKIFDPKEQKHVPWHGNRLPCIEWNKRTRESGRSILTQEDATNLEGMALSLGRHPSVGQGLLRGHVEHSYFWIDESTGVWCKWRPDTTPPGSLDFVDLKTTTDVRKPALVKTLRERAYYAQGGLGRIACRTLLGQEMQSFTLMFIEKEQPWSTALMQVKDHVLARGEMLCRAGLDTFAKCWKDNSWPGPQDAEALGYIELSDIALMELDETLKQFGINPA